MSDAPGCNENSPAKPCLVHAGQGFSVIYKNRSLYSRYDPSKAVVQSVKSLNILPGTLILAISPCLWYGLTELLSQLPENCLILGIEYDKNLYELARDELTKITGTNTVSPVKKNVLLLPPEEVCLLPSLLSVPDFKTPSGIMLPSPGTFRRAIPLVMSAGNQFYADIYKTAADNAEQVISQFWKNRLTLVKLGRLFSRNLFKNMRLLPSSVPLESFMRTVSKTILVLGAGESAENTLKAVLESHARSSLYIIAVDASIPLLRSFGITPDAAAALESQWAIEQAYVGSVPLRTTLFADITSRPAVTNHIDGTICFFSSSYTESLFYKRLEHDHILPYTIPALGSVGLTAVYIALLLRSSADVPVFVSGLDFSFTQGTTHARGTPSVHARLRSCMRLRPAANYDASFRQGAHEAVVQSRGNSVCAQSAACRRYTDTALEGYAASFADIFADIKNLFNTASTGLDLGIQQRTNEDLIACAQTESDHMQFSQSSNKQESPHASSVSGLLPTEQTIGIFFENEKKALGRIKDLLSKGAGASRINNGISSAQNPDAPLTDTEVRGELTELLEKREYLYLHFPDGYKCDVLNISFLKRIRVEIDFFLKDFKS